VIFFVGAINRIARCIGVSVLRKAVRVLGDIVFSGAFDALPGDAESPMDFRLSRGSVVIVTPDS